MYNYCKIMKIILGTHSLILYNHIRSYKIVCKKREKIKTPSRISFDLLRYDQKIQFKKEAYLNLSIISMKSTVLLLSISFYLILLCSIWWTTFSNGTITTVSGKSMQLIYNETGRSRVLHLFNVMTFAVNYMYIVDIVITSERHHIE